MAISSLKLSDIDERNSAVKKLDMLIAQLAEKTGSAAFCSRDSDVAAARSELLDLIPAHFSGVTRWFLPVASPMPSDGNGRFSAYTTCLASGAEVAGQKLEASIGALKVVVSGSIAFRGHSLTAGDWIWLPAGEIYGFTAEKFGAVLFTVLPCVPEIETGDRVFGLHNADFSGGFVTSRDPSVAGATVSLGQVEQYAERAAGVTHSFFPFAPTMPVTDVEDGRFLAWLARIEPNTAIPAHVHDLEKLADYKLVISGSIVCRGKELTAGDWLWAPAGGAYAFTAGDQGALLLAGWPWN